MVAGLEPGGTEQLREPLRSLVELCVGDHLAAPGHDHCRGVALGRDVVTWLHVVFPSISLQVVDADSVTEL